MQAVTSGRQPLGSSTNSASLDEYPGPGPRESRGVLRFGRDQPSLAWHEQYLLAEWVFWRERHSGIEKVFRGRRRAKPLPRGRRRERASRSWAVVTTDHEAPARNRRPHQDRPSQSMERTEPRD